MELNIYYNLEQICLIERSKYECLSEVTAKIFLAKPCKDTPSIIVSYV